MALAHARVVTQAQAKAAATNMQAALAASLNNGEAIVVICMTDNLATATGPSNTHSDAFIELTATPGSIQALTKAGEYTFSPTGAAGDGVTTSIWYAKASQNYTTSHRFVVNFTGSITAKVLLANAFTMGAATVLAHDPTTDGDGAATDPASRTLSGLTSREWLVVRGIGGESAATTLLTPTSTWSTFTAGTQTSGGGAATNISGRGEYKIATATSFTSDPTKVAEDYSSLMVAIYEQTAAAPAPPAPQILGARSTFH